MTKKVLLSLGGLVIIIGGYCLYKACFVAEEMSSDTTVVEETAASDSMLSLNTLEQTQSFLNTVNASKKFPTWTNEGTIQKIGFFNGEEVVMDYWCSDVCPDNGVVFMSYLNVDEARCEELRGYALYGVGWGEQYLGCSPVSSPLSE